MPPSTIEDEIVIDGAHLLSLVLQHWRRLIASMLFTAVVFFAYRALISPQSYVAEASVVVQQPGGAVPSALGGLFGQSTSKRYVGVLKSRNLATEVDKRLSLRAVLGLKKDKDLFDVLTKGIKPRDDADGLLYIEITLFGPPRFGSDPLGLRNKLPRLAADVADTYADLLRRYYVDSDNERDTVLQRNAELESRRARRDYAEAVSRLRAVQRAYKGSDPRTIPVPTASMSGAADPLFELPGLFTALSQVETDIQQLETTLQAQGVRVKDQLSNVTSLPAEDPLLTTERGRYQEEMIRLRNLEVRLGPAAMDVVVQRARVSIAKAYLDAAVKSVRLKLSTEVQRDLNRLEGLRAKRTTLELQVKKASSFLRTRQERSIMLEDLRTEIALKFEALKISITEVAKLRIGTVSAQSKVVQIDRAVPPIGGAPGMSRYFLEAVVVSLLAPLLLLVWGYGRGLRRDSTV